MNKFKGLDLVNRVLEELWTEVHNIVQEVVTKTKEKKRKKAKWLSEPYKQLRKERQRRKEEIYPTECRVPENSEET